PAAVLTIIATYSRGFPRYMQPAIAGLVMFSGFCITLMIVIAPEPASYSYYAGNILVIIFGYAFFRLRFVWATFAGWAVFAGYQIAALWFTETPISVLINNDFFFLSANVIGMFASYSIEQYARRDFFLVNELTRERAAVETARDELEARVEVRTRQAMAAARSKSDFLANMSHEIRTPMNGILGMLDLLRESPLNSSQQEQADTAFHSANGLLVILNDVLDLSKIEAGKMELHLEPVSPGEIIEEVGAILYPQADGKGLDLFLLLHPGVFESHLLDATRLRQVLLNLLGNAVKFTQHGHVAVRCKLSNATSGSSLIIEIADTGVGIADTERDALFEAFSQADNSTTRHFGGTGLGLTITRRLVALMGGTIDVSSTRGVGSCFTVELPLSTAAESDPLPVPGINRVAVEVTHPLLDEALQLLLANLGCQIVYPADAQLIFSNQLTTIHSAAATVFVADRAAVVPAEAALSLSQPIRLQQVAALLQADQPSMVRDRKPQVKHALAGLRVLLVEDNEVNRRVAGAMLKRAGIEWVAARSGEEALTLWDDDSFDLVLMDCQMPGMDGYQTTAVLRERERHNNLPATPVIALTANAMEGDRETCLAAGMNDYLAKPVDMARLHDALLRWAPGIAPAGS
ncbi:MAG: ATP-binding protein, partial [Gammaproteobacteria bacterium]|nr:ATP-binding protein [Gammaproteobacteria bacterium]